MPEPGPPAQEVAAGLGPGRGEALALSRSHHRRCLGQKDAHEARFVMGQLPLNCLWALAPKPWDEHTNMHGIVLPAIASQSFAS